MADVLIEREDFLASLEGLLGDVRRGCCDNITTVEALGPLTDALPELAGCWTTRRARAGSGGSQQVRDVLAQAGCPTPRLLNA
jgi:hypothetical protein